MSLSIIIVNYRSASLVLDCLKTIYAHGSNDEVIIVDNDSGDASRSLIVSAFPQVKWVQMDYNSGFARGNNAGIKIAKGDIILLLNSDTLIEDNAIQLCYERLSQSDHVAAGVQLLNMDRTPQISGNFFMTGGLNHLMNLPYTGRIIRGIGLLMRIKKTNVANATGTVEVDWINGAFLMVKKSACEKAGLLDEDFFLYSEEIEWCSRLKKTGKLCIYGDLHVVHLMGATTSKAFVSKSTGYTELSDRKGFQLIISGLLRIRKQFGVGWFLFHLLGYVCTIPIFLIIAILKTPFILTAAAVEWSNWFGFTRNTLKAVALAPKIITKKPHFYKLL
jgi:GT2 family glycosyltransferase